MRRKIPGKVEFTTPWAERAGEVEPHAHKELSDQVHVQLRIMDGGAIAVAVGKISAAASGVRSAVCERGAAGGIHGVESVATGAASRRAESKVDLRRQLLSNEQGALQREAGP